MSIDAPESAKSPGSASFLVTLLRRGTPALATATSELSDEVGDPTPVRAFRRISRMSGTVDTTQRDGLLLRAARYVVLVPLAYRIVSVPGAFAGFVAAHHGQGALPAGLVALAAVAL